MYDVMNKIEFLEWLCAEIPMFKSFKLSKHPNLLNSQLEMNALHILDNQKLCTIGELVLPECQLRIPRLGFV